nr:nucleotidyltransferase domain-containing protein [Parachlamydia acanthamoebae]
MDLKELKESNCIIFECISGSKAYGLSTETSDEDIRGVFILPREKFSHSRWKQMHIFLINKIVVWRFKG